MSVRPRVVVVQNSPRSGPGRLLGWLAEDGIDAVVVDGPDLPEHLDGGAEVVDGIVLLGARFMPDDDEHAPFLPREPHLLQRPGEPRFGTA